jgi:hypothetical protein
MARGRSAGMDYPRLNLSTTPDQIPVLPQDVPKTVIMTPFGLWEFKQVTFLASALSASPSRAYNLDEFHRQNPSDQQR